MLFIVITDSAYEQLTERGLLFHRMGRGQGRLVTSFQTTDADVDAVLAAFAAVL